MPMKSYEEIEYGRDFRNKPRSRLRCIGEFIGNVLMVRSEGTGSADRKSIACSNTRVRMKKYIKTIT